MNGFAHENLIAYQVAKEFATQAQAIARQIPRGDGDLADQLRRAARSMVLNIAEGAGRRSPKEQAHFFDTARASGTECAAALDLAEIGGAQVGNARETLRRAVCLGAGLARAALRRAG